MLETFETHNAEKLPLTLSLPNEDIFVFRDKLGGDWPNIRVVPDESYCGNELRGHSGWHGQQISKLLSCRIMDTEHYVLIDSDCYFIRDIVADEFRPRSGRPYIACGSSLRTVFKESNKLLLGYINGDIALNPEWLPRAPTRLVDRLDEFLRYRDLDQFSPDAIARSDIPFKVFGSERWIYFQPGQIFSKRLLEQLLTYFVQHGVSAADAIRISPWEYNWYGEYAATHAFSETEFRISPFLHFQDPSDLDFARQDGALIEKLRPQFPIIAMAARHINDLRL